MAVRTAIELVVQWAILPPVRASVGPLPLLLDSPFDPAIGAAALAVASTLAA